MMTHADAGILPAFPTTLDTVHDRKGLTLRQYYAGQALAGYLANPELTGPGKELDHAVRLAYACVDAADALLVALTETSRR
jgi:hypothetical protein